MTEHTEDLPQPAGKTIDVVLDEFLEEQRTRLKPSTMRKYENVIHSLKSCLDNYAYQGLDKQQSAFFNSLYNAKGAQHREFCQVFGPEKILDNVGEFLGYYMVRKVICGKQLKQAAGIVVRKLGKWLLKKRYVHPEGAARMANRGAVAAKELPATEELARMLADYAARAPVDYDDVIEDHFTIESVEPEKLHLSQLAGDEQMTIPVSRNISDACRVGWSISGALCRTSKGWRILDVWNVYP